MEGLGVLTGAGSKRLLCVAKRIQTILLCLLFAVLIANILEVACDYARGLFLIEESERHRSAIKIFFSLILGAVAMARLMQGNSASAQNPFDRKRFHILGLLLTETSVEMFMGVSLALFASYAKNLLSENPLPYSFFRGYLNAFVKTRALLGVLGMTWFFLSAFSKMIPAFFVLLLKDEKLTQSFINFFEKKMRLA